MTRLIVLLPVVIAFLVGAVPALAWTWPVDGPVLQPFSFGADPYEGGQHRGVDIGSSVGSPVRAPVGGSVTFIGWVPGGGRTLTIRTPDGYAVTLQQLGTESVSRGAVVVEGDPIGTVGASNEADMPDPHVHLGVRVASDPNGYLDPLGFLPSAPGGGEPELEASASTVDTDSTMATPGSEPASPIAAVSESVVEPSDQEGTAPPPEETPVGDMAAAHAPGGTNTDESHGSVVPIPSAGAVPRNRPATAETRQVPAPTNAQTRVPPRKTPPRQPARPWAGSNDRAGAAFSIEGSAGRDETSSPARANRTVARAASIRSVAHAEGGLHVDTDGTPDVLLPAGLALSVALLAACLCARRRRHPPDAVDAVVVSEGVVPPVSGDGEPLSRVSPTRLSTGAGRRPRGRRAAGRSERRALLGPPELPPGVRIIAVDDLLHHDSDLLRELDAPHRPCVHDDRGRRRRAASPAAR